jgi:hypothetical protein
MAPTLVDGKATVKDGSEPAPLARVRRLVSKNTRLRILFGHTLPERAIESRSAIGRWLLDVSDLHGSGDGAGQENTLVARGLIFAARQRELHTGHFRGGQRAAASTHTGDAAPHVPESMSAVETAATQQQVATRQNQLCITILLQYGGGRDRDRRSVMHGQRKRGLGA